MSDPTRVDQPAPDTGALERGTTIGGRYRLEGPLATGGMATVWRATDTVLTRPVAVKVLHAHLAADPEFVARFRREAVAAARLTHPAIVAIYDTCDDPEAIVMELVEGRTLRDELDQRGFLPTSEAVAVASSICQALDVAHKAGIVHRDVKPANVLLSAGGQLKVADFGIAKAARDAAGTDDDDLPDLTAIGRMVGTAKYLAPEQVSGGEVDARTDVYAVGAVLYEMLCGRPPFTGGNDLAVAVARLHAPPPRTRSVRRTVPPRLDDIVMKALSIDPDHRQPSASALWADLQSCPVDDEPVPTPGTHSTSAGDAPSFARSERSWLVPAMLVSLVAFALGLAWVLIGGTEAPRQLFGVFDGGDAADEGDAVAAGTPLALADPTAFDPQGRPPGVEHNDEAPSAVDGNPATGWTTETYESADDFRGLKDGVGLFVDLGSVAEVGEVVLTTPAEGWAATVHLAEEPGTDLAAWGPPVGAVDAGSAGDTTIEVSQGAGRYLLVWVTDLGGRSFELQEIGVRAR